MDGKALLAFVDQMHRDRGISRETLLGIIEQAVRLATEKYFGERDISEDITVSLDSHSGVITARKGDSEVDPSLLGRIAAQAAKQSLIQKIREVESDAVLSEYSARKGDLVKATVTRYEHGTATATIGNSKVEAILPRGEQIPGETHHVGDRIDAVIIEVKKNGHRVKIILSRAHPEFVRRLFFKEIPEINDHTIEMRAIAREAGYRTKVAVSSIDSKVDCVGACVGVRGSRIKNIVESLGGERIDIVRWNESLQVLIKNSLQPAEIEEVFLYHRLGRAIVLVQEDHLSLAIGRRGQNVRLASKLVGWDIEIMTMDEYNESIVKAETGFLTVPHLQPEVVESLIVEGFLSLDDLGNCIEADELAEIAGVTAEQAQEMIDYAEAKAEELGEEARTPRGGGDSDGRTLAISRPNPAAEARKILGDTAAPVRETTPTFEQLFREKTGPAAPTEPAPATEPETPAGVSLEEPTTPPETAPVADAPTLVEQTARQNEASGDHST